jgi:hypothetical protein
VSHFWSVGCRFESCRGRAEPPGQSATAVALLALRSFPGHGGQCAGAKRLGHRAVLRLSWLLLVASVALSTLLQIAVAPATLVGYLTAGATPVWLRGSFAVLSLLYHADTSATPAAAAAEASAEPAPTSAAVAASSAPAPQARAEVLTKRAQAERVYADLSATGAPVTAGQLAAAAGLSPSYARALVVQFQVQPPAALHRNGRRPVPADADPEAVP